MHNDPLKKIRRKDKEAKIALSWRGKLYPFGKVTWQPNGTFVFRSDFHRELQGEIEWGSVVSKDGKLVPIEDSKSKTSHPNLHFTLHVPEANKDGCMVVHGDGEEVRPENRRSMDWFPVVKPFHLLTVVSPSLQYLLPTDSHPDYKIHFPDEYTGAVQCTFDILPTEPTVVAAPASMIAVTPHYNARLTFLGIGEQRTGISVIWPIGSKLEL